MGEMKKIYGVFGIVFVLIIGTLGDVEITSPTTNVTVHFPPPSAPAGHGSAPPGAPGSSPPAGTLDSSTSMAPGSPGAPAAPTTQDSSPPPSSPRAARAVIITVILLAVTVVAGLVIIHERRALDPSGVSLIPSGSPRPELPTELPLPRDLMEKIINHTDWTDRGSLLLVSKTFYQMCRTLNVQLALYIGRNEGPPGLVVFKGNHWGAAGLPLLPVQNIFASQEPGEFFASSGGVSSKLQRFDVNSGTWILMHEFSGFLEAVYRSGLGELAVAVRSENSMTVNKLQNSGTWETFWSLSGGTTSISLASGLLIWKHGDNEGTLINPAIHPIDVNLESVNQEQFTFESAGDGFYGWASMDPGLLTVVKFKLVAYMKGLKAVVCSSYTYNCGDFSTRVLATAGCDQGFVALVSTEDQAPLMNDNEIFFRYVKLVIFQEGRVKAFPSPVLGDTADQGVADVCFEGIEPYYKLVHSCGTTTCRSW